MTGARRGRAGVLARWVLSAPTRLLLVTLPVQAGQAVVGSTLGQRLRDYVSRPLTIVALAVLVGCSLLLVSLRARAIRRQRGREE